MRSTIIIFIEGLTLAVMKSGRPVELYIIFQAGAIVYRAPVQKEYLWVDKLDQIASSVTHPPHTKQGNNTFAVQNPFTEPVGWTVS